MKPISRRLATMAASLGLVGLLAFGSTGHAFAASVDGNSGTPSAQISGGSLSGGHFTFSGHNFADVTLNGTAQSSAATWPIANIVDSTGTANGWKLTLQLSQLTGATHTMPTSSITVATAPTVAPVAGTGSGNGTGITPVAAAAALDTGSEVTILDAAADATTMGSFSVTSMGVSLAIPATTYADTYSTNATVSLYVGP